eukprot:3521320-Ditylum_brightwellii.AAC.1
MLGSVIYPLILIHNYEDIGNRRTDVQKRPMSDYTTKENGKRQKHSDKDIDFNSNMDETDTLCEENRDALAPDK